MSMLSSQADRLRAWANQLSERDDLGPVRFAVASDLREAARTILELRDRLTHWELHECPGCKNVADLQEALDENAELRDDLQRANDAVQDAEHDESIAWDRVRKAESENAKLRELVRDMWEVIVHARDGVSYDKEREFCDRFRELRVGMEVGE